MDKLVFCRAVVAAIPSMYNICPDDEQAIINLLSVLPVKEVPEGEDDREEYVSYCPNCGEEIKNEKYKFCPYCGQGIFWEWR